MAHIKCTATIDGAVCEETAEWWVLGRPTCRTHLVGRVMRDLTWLVDTGPEPGNVLHVEPIPTKEVTASDADTQIA